MYTRPHDYVLYCDTQTLTQVINSSLSTKRLCEYAAEDQIRSYLSQRYDFAKPYGEFTDTEIYSNTTQYVGNSRIYLDGDAWVSGTYAENAIVSQSGNVYMKNATTSGYTNQAPTNATFWTLLGTQYDLYFVTPPAAAWDYTREYLISTIVFYKGKSYTAAINSKNIPPDSTYGSVYWGTGTTYTIPVGTLPSDTAYWTNGDNRNNYLLQLYICIVIYNMFIKVAPRNIPQPRTDAYNQAIDWLEKAGKGTVTAELPLIAPEQGSSLRWGSVPLSNNIY